MSHENRNIEERVGLFHGQFRFKTLFDCGLHRSKVIFAGRALDLNSTDRLREMEAKLRVIIDDHIKKLVLPSGIPPTIEELQSVVKDTFGITNDFSLQYFDSEFEDYFTLNSSDQIKHKDTVKVVGIPPVVLTLAQLDESLGSPSGQQSTDYESSYDESFGSNADSAATTSSQDTIILKRNKTTERCEPWPKQFPIPQFAYETEMYLENATEEFKKNGTLLPTSKVKTDILEKLAETIFRFTAYPSSAQVSCVAEALVTKYPCLKEPGSFSGYYGWLQRIKYKMANYRTKLRGFGVPEVTCNAVTCKMAKTFAHRRHEIINLSPSIEDIKARWPALFEASHLQDEFYRITMVHLESKFMSMLDMYTPKLLALFHAKGGAMGLKLQTILAKSPPNPNIDITRDLVIQCLMVYLGESIDGLIKEYSDAEGDDVSQDLSEQKMKIYKIKAAGSEVDDIGIVLEGVRVMPALGTFPRACAMLVGLTYAVDLAYPKELRYTLEVFQKLFLELDCASLSPKVNSLKNKLMV
ncbi:uncharacterized protein LOC108247045 isoform X3 [Kryptolebias marmoratus]|uniref:uncharacterized protein LOC108247045 isoform X3 n=1 Tax=Kryptolebias marmoratus TaxID=37003 RepID=UPI0018ACD18C|nr:uncharacterized protein LOC108247045 isoform X3 [Kryptolebias marmoratus]